MILPDIGCSVTLLETGQEDWLTQRLIGSGKDAEDSVLWWGGLGRRWKPGDQWKPRFNGVTVDELPSTAG